MITVIILSLLIALFALIAAGIAVPWAVRVTKSNFVLQEQKGEYDRFFEVLTETLVTDTHFMRSEVIKELPMEIPKYKKLNSEIISFENKILQLKEASLRLKSGEEW